MTFTSTKGAVMNLEKLWSLLGPEPWRPTPWPEDVVRARRSSTRQVSVEWEGDGMRPGDNIRRSVQTEYEYVPETKTLHGLALESFWSDYDRGEIVELPWEDFSKEARDAYFEHARLTDEWSAWNDERAKLNAAFVGDDGREYIPVWSIDGYPELIEVEKITDLDDLGWYGPASSRDQWEEFMDEGEG